MNSPAAFQASQFPGQQPFNLSQPPLQRRPTSSAGSALNGRPPSASQSPALSQQGFNDPSEAIRKGKQRAQEMMSASGLSGGLASSQVSTQNAPQVNGTVMSRKRSRSGSRIAHQVQTSSAAEVIPLKDERSKDLLFQYMQRDALAEDAQMEKVRGVEALADIKRQELARYRKDVYEMKESLRGRIHPDPVGPPGSWIPEIVYPGYRRRPFGRMTPELRLSRKAMRQQAECLEDLVPVRLDFEVDKVRVRDSFTWNLHDRMVNLELFAKGLVEDLQVPDDHRDLFFKQLSHQMREQIHDYYPPVWPMADGAEPGMLYWAHKNDDMRIMVKLNITVGYITLIDQFEWDINNPANSPEEFALQMARDLSLAGEFTTAIAHAIREQSQLYYKALFLTNYEFDGRPIEDGDIRDNLMASPLYSVFRPHQMQKDHSPFLFEITEADLEKIEVSLGREMRAQKRSVTNRRGGPALPDLKDRQRTARSLIVSSVIPAAAETLEASGVIKIKRQSNRGKRRIVDDGSDDDDDDLEDSGPDSPAPGLGNIGTTARTRGMRGAATAAQAALRQSYGRSATPDSFLETPRRKVVEIRDEDPDAPSLIVKLKIAPARFRTWLAKKRFGRSGAPPLSGFPTSALKIVEPPPSKTETPRPGNRAIPKKSRDETPGKDSAGTPRPKSRAADRSKEYNYTDNGCVLVDVLLPSTEEPPPIPTWLAPALAPLHKQYPTASFEPLMKLMVLNAATNESISYPLATLKVGDAAPKGPITKKQKNEETGEEELVTLAEETRLGWMPRIRCNDCPNKSYNAFREGTAERFGVHFRTSKHKENLEKRIGRGR